MFAPSCPCGSTLPYDACCGPLHRGVRDAASAVELMRSRYAAYARGGRVGADYLFRTWHPRTRPAPDELDLGDGSGWTGLEIHGYGEDWVEFTAHHVNGDLYERSRFQRRAGRWLYLDGEVG